MGSSNQAQFSRNYGIMLWKFTPFDDYYLLLLNRAVHMSK